MEAVVAEVLTLFVPAILEFVALKLKGASSEVALMQSIAKLEDARAKAKFPGYGG